jgi:hypothetical protein
LSGEELERIRASIKWLRTEAVKTSWKTSPDRRRATPEELAVAEADKAAHPKVGSFCVAHSVRTGLPCTKFKNLGMTVCGRHGGSVKRVKKKARERLTGILMSAIDTMHEMSQQRDHLPTARAAAKDIVDRLLPALRREEGASSRQQALTPVVNIGVVLGGVDQKPALTVSQVPAKALPAKDGEVEE